MRTSRVAICLIVIASAVRIALATFIPLFPDETYYWDWSRHLAAGYFDHPPAIALLIRSGTTVFGATPLGVRIGVVLAGSIASLALVVTSWRLSGQAADPTPVLDDPGVRAAALMLVIPAALVGFIIATPDAPLLAASALTIAALERAIAAPVRSRESLRWWCAAGVTLGLAFCSKYTAVLIPLGVFIALLTRRDLRVRLAEPGPYAAAIIALLVLTPTLVWNAHHGWISFAFQLQHGLGSTHGSVIGRELSLIGGQLGLVSPIIAALGVIAVARGLRRVADARKYVFAVIATTIIAFFAVSALRRPVEPNWPVLALVAALPLLATYRSGRRLRGWLVAGSALGLVCTSIIVAQAATRVIAVSPRRDPLSKAFGWNDLASSVHRAAQEAAARGCTATWIAADRYQDASELAFNLSSHPRVFALNLGGRANQYDLWPSIYAVAGTGDCAVVVVDVGAGGESVVHRIGAEDATTLGEATMTWRGVPVGRRAIWLVRGLPSAPPSEVYLSPAAKTALAAAATTFSAHATLLDSIVSTYLHGPIPNVIGPNSAASISNADRHAAIAARLESLHGLLQRSGFSAVYRDARYRDCTFVRATPADSTDVGYVYAPQGCTLATGRSDRLLRVQHVHGAWYAYASPERFPD